MAMNRDDVLRRIVTAAEYIEHNSDRMSAKTREEAMRRYDALCAELETMTEAEKAFKAQVPEKVREEMDKIRDILKRNQPKGEC